MAAKKNYQIMIDGNWTLEDLMEFSRLYFQNYSFIYCLETETVGVASFQIKSVLEDYKLRDGLSYVNIYSTFRNHIKAAERPKIKSIQYASPGWIELALNPDVAMQVAKSVGIYMASITGTGASVVLAYKKLHKIFIDLQQAREKKRNRDLKLEKDKVAAANKLNEELAKGLGFNSLADLDKHTGDIEETSKLLMAHYRRISRMSEFVKNNKAKFPLKLS